VAKIEMIFYSSGGWESGCLERRSMTMVRIQYFSFKLIGEGGGGGQDEALLENEAEAVSSS
jgi:hypothetical protein